MLMTIEKGIDITFGLCIIGIMVLLILGYIFDWD